MKKVLLLWLTVCFCIALCACTATDPNNLFETTEKPDDTTVLGTDETQTEPNDVILYTGTYQYGNMQQNAPSSSFMLLGNEVLFRRLVNGNVWTYSYNLRTGQVQFFCKDASCKHEDCTATIFGNLEVYNGKLYGKWEPRGTEGDFDLKPVAVNGNKVEVIVDARIYTFLHHEDKLYLHTADSSLVVLEEGQKEPQMVLEEYTGDMDIIFGNYLYATKWGTGIIRIDLTAESPQEEVLIENARGMTDGQHIYYVELTNRQLYRCNMDGSDPVLIDEREVGHGTMNFDEEYFYYRLYTDRKMEGTPDCYDVYRFPKDDPTQIEKIATLPVPIYRISTVPGTGKIFVESTLPDQNKDADIFIMDCDGSNMKKLDIPE